MKTEYILATQMRFDAEEDREASYTKVKAFLVANKLGDKMTYVSIVKTERQTATESSETL